jgi:hypothetical protein
VTELGLVHACKGFKIKEQKDAATFAWEVSRKSNQSPDTNWNHDLALKKAFFSGSR